MTQIEAHPTLLLYSLLFHLTVFLRVLSFVDLTERERKAAVSLNAPPRRRRLLGRLPHPALLVFPFLSSYLSLSFSSLPDIEATSCKRAAHPEEELLLHGTA